ncbi:MAG: ABC transporter ATP-binding protein [Gemmatimonadota bacterium]|nr:ABC transporter ATP-binding protein [Gemmatimonadota bacterium]
MIQYEHVTIAYDPGGKPVVNDVSFLAPRGEVTAVVGPNGSGKSTLVRALLGRVGLQSGRIMLDGVDIRTLARGEIARRCAVVTQREETLFTRRVEEYIALGRYPRRDDRRGEHGEHGDGATSDANAVSAAARRASVDALLTRGTDELSGGEWQRVRIARALAQGGEALVLDEPTSFLDIAHEMEIFQLAVTLAEAGTAVLLVSHQLNLVARFAHTMILLHDGAVAAQGKPDDVMRGELLERVYGWPLVVTRDPAVNAPTLVPLRRPN